MATNRGPLRRSVPIRDSQKAAMGTPLSFRPLGEIFLDASLIGFVAYETQIDVQREHRA
jgi:hypothetical protein